MSRIGDALGVLEAAIDEHLPTHVFALFSGGHDSLAALAVTARHPEFTAAVHINTGIGIKETREFVRETCKTNGWPLLEYHPDGKTYRDLVIDKGMPAGPKAHSTTYYWLKQRQVRRLVAEHKIGRHGRIVLTTGVRASESSRRMAAAIAVPVRRLGAQVWVNPILDWSAADCSALIAEDGLARNPVTDKLHRSGECLCGAMAHWSEIRDIAFWYPEAAAEIHEYEALAREHGHIEDVWARRLRGVNRNQGRLDMPLCLSCDGSALAKGSQ